VWLLIGLLIGLFIAGLALLRHHSLHRRPPEPIRLATSKKATVAKPSKEKKPAPPKENKVRFDFYTMLPNAQTHAVPKASKESVATNAATAKTLSQAEEAVILPHEQPAPKPQKTAPAKISEPHKANIKPAAVQDTPPRKVQQEPPPPVQKQTAQTAPKKPVATTPAATSSYILQMAAFRHYQDADQLKAELILLGYPAKVTATSRDGVGWQRVWLGPYPSATLAENAQQRLQNQHIHSVILKLK
jgi:cell division protein FtsN